MMPSSFWPSSILSLSSTNFIVYVIVVMNVLGVCIVILIVIVNDVVVIVTIVYIVLVLCRLFHCPFRSSQRLYRHPTVFGIVNDVSSLWPLLTLSISLLCHSWTRSHHLYLRSLIFVSLTIEGGRGFKDTCNFFPFAQWPFSVPFVKSSKEYDLELCNFFSPCSMTFFSRSRLSGLVNV